MKECRVKDVVRIMQDWAPQIWAEGFDNPGLMVGRSDMIVRGIYVALDPKPSVVRCAIENGCNLIVTHHPMFLSGGVRAFVGGSDDLDVDTALLCAKNDVALYAAHTNLDRARHGVNDCLCESLGWENAGVLPDAFESGDPAMPKGLARLAKLPKQMTLKETAHHVADCLKVQSVEFIGDQEMPVSFAALCGGSGGEFVCDAMKAGAQVLVTGEAKHHQRVAASELGFGIIVAGHAETEQVVVPKIASTLQNALDAIQCKISVIWEKSSAITRRTVR